jgi:glucose-6-phosphate isomerase, archaeal
MSIEPPTLTEPVKLTIRPEAGVLAGSNERYEKRLRELAGVYRDEAAFEALTVRRGDEVAYWVESNTTQRDAGGLITGLSVLGPGRVGEEYFMTRGHLHVRAECGETYLGVRGTGVMLLDSLDGRSHAIEISPGEAVYVPGGWVHRSVNVGDDLLVTLFCYPADAGQDYELIRRAGGMSQLVVASPTGWTTRPNPDHPGYGSADGPRAAS